ncbi:MAG: glycosyltransferase [Nitrospiraceae bacterium]|nr:glycosyltransferase [Nitrospiraceae bacterium]
MERIAVLIPCFNEEKTIAGVVRDFRRQLPDADIYVYDNNSEDGTVAEALSAGAIVRSEKRQGKGNVMRTMFKTVDADIYVMVDGDGTYPAERVHDLLAPITKDEADMVIGSRLHRMSESQFKPMNRFGNRIFLSMLNSIFKVRVTDLLSGYRAFNRNIVKSLPLLSTGFEIETELTIKSLDRGFRVEEVPIDLSARPPGSESKIKILRDGFLIVETIFALFRDYKPMTAFGVVGLLLMAAGFIPGTVVIDEFLLTGLIYHLPSAVLAVGLILSGLLVGFVGLILHTVARRFQEVDHRLQNLREELFTPEGKKRVD